MMTEQDESTIETPSSTPQSSTAQTAASPAEGENTSAVTPQGTTPAGDPASAKPRIKIGTQREGVVPPKLPPRTQTVFTTEPPGAKRPPPAAKREPIAEATTPPPSTVEVMSPHEKPATDAPRDMPAEGSQIEASQAEVVQAAPELRPKPAPLTPGVERRPKPELEGAKIPRPNLRAALSPDLEQELAESLGDLSLEEVLKTDERSKHAAPLELESRVKARVVRVHREDVFVELAGMNQGVIPVRNFVEPPEMGAILDVVVARYNAEEGLYELALLGGAVDVGDWSDIAEGITVEARITGHNKGGLECEVNHIRGFMPVSQISLYRVEDLEQFVGQKFPCVVTEANPDRRNLVLSRRAVLEREAAEAKQRLIAELAEGQEREGVVRNIRDFGAFVDLGGVDGMLHISQLSWDRVKHPSDVLSLGQKIKVKIQRIDPDSGKISLSYRDTFESPWASAATRYPVTSRVKGTVSKIMDFGAFVRLEPGVEGLVHISELSHKRVHRVSDIVQEGQEIEAKVLSVDTEAQRMSLSMKSLEAQPEAPSAEDEAAAEEQESPARKTPPKRTVPLKGGLGRGKGGAEFGLRW